jgi:imidazolonepropionase-like amidohydrolase
MVDRLVTTRVLAAWPWLVFGLALLACRTDRSVKVAPSARSAPSVLVVRGTLLGPRGTAIDDAVVVVEGGRITAAGPAASVAVPAGAATIGGPGQFIAPGLIDAHVHFFQSGGLYTRPDVIDLRARVPYAQEVDRIRAGLDRTFRRYLRAGVTSVVDFGGPAWNFEVRKAAVRNALAPRVAVAGPLLASVARPQLDLGDPPIVQVTDPAAARAMVRGQATHRPDFVKLWWVVPPGQRAEAWEPVGRAAIEEAHALGLRVAVHATELETARVALRAGADVLVHSVIDAEVDDDFIRLLRERNVPYITTLTVFGGYVRVLNHEVRLSGAEMELGDPSIAATLVEPFDVPQGRHRQPIGPAAARNARRLRDAGVTVAAGSDAGNIGTLHAAGLHQELELLVEAGFTPAEALDAATVQAARVLGGPDLGSVEVGRVADLLVVDADPRADIRNLRRIAWVVKDGTPHRPDEILPRTAEDVVQAQVNAYNAQDLEAFVSTYAEEAVVARSGGEILLTGKTALRERYGGLFRRFPQNRVRIAERRTQGAGRVEDHEIITGRSPEKPDPWDVGWVRYDVDGGLIRRVELP